MNFIKTRGLVIKKNDFGEADRLLTIFSENFGKINLLVKGIRKSKRRDKNATEVLTISDFVFYKKGDNYILTTMDIKEYFYDLKKDINKVEVASYIISLINEIVMHGEIKRELFNRVEKALNFIEKNDEIKNYIMITKMLYWIIKNEGYLMEIHEDNEIEFSGKEVLEKQLEIEKNMENLSIENLIECIELYENYLNYNLELKIKFKKHLFGGSIC